MSTPTQPIPLLVLKGWRSLLPHLRSIERRFHKLTPHTPDTTLVPTYNSFLGIPAIAEHIDALVRERWPNATHIDIAAVSMGGLISRHLAAHPPHPNSPRIRTLYTTATPHRGAVLAHAFFFLDKCAAEMQPGSALLADLDQALENPDTRPQRIVTFSRTRDWWVGTHNTRLANPEHAAAQHDIASPPHTLAHLFATLDKTIPNLIADDINNQPHIETPSPGSSG